MERILYLLITAATECFFKPSRLHNMSLLCPLIPLPLFYYHRHYHHHHHDHHREIVLINIADNAVKTTVQKFKG